MDTDNGSDAETTTIETPPEVSGGDAPRSFADGAEPVEPELVDGWSPARVEPETGFALDGHGLPVNHRLRAERLANAGEDEDPAGTVSPELIADAKTRLENERKAFPPLRANMKTEDLERIAKAEGVDISAANTNAERLALIEATRPPSLDPANEGTS